MIEYGAAAEACLRNVLRQLGNNAVAETFDEVIDKSKAAGVLTRNGAEEANRLRLARNKVHLHLLDERPLRAERDGRAMWKARNTVINECRVKCGLPEWTFL